MRNWFNCRDAAWLDVARITAGSIRAANAAKAQRVCGDRQTRAPIPTVTG